MAFEARLAGRVKPKNETRVGHACGEEKAGPVIVHRARLPCNFSNKASLLLLFLSVYGLQKQFQHRSDFRSRGISSRVKEVAWFSVNDTCLEECFNRLFSIVGDVRLVEEAGVCPCYRMFNSSLSPALCAGERSSGSVTAVEV